MILEVPILATCSIALIVIPLIEPLLFKLLPVAKHELIYCKVNITNNFITPKTIYIRYSYNVSGHSYKKTRRFPLIGYYEDLSNIKPTIVIRYFPFLESVSLLESNVKFRSNRIYGLILGSVCSAATYLVYWLSITFPEHATSLF